MRRDWTALATAELPTLPSYAQELVAELEALAVDQRWDPGPRQEAARTLRILLAWLGCDAPIPEVEIMSLATTVPRPRGPAASGSSRSSPNMTCWLLTQASSMIRMSGGSTA